MGLTGQIPSSIKSLSILTWLDLKNNQLSGEITPSLGSLRFLGFLDLSFNQLNGTIPTSLGISNPSLASISTTTGLAG
jgi:Leucine-rich repeat (LRR) protein